MVAADLAMLINPGLRSPRTRLVVLPGLSAVQAERDRGVSEADAVETVVNRGLAAMAAGSHDEGLPRLATADPVRALKAALALRPGSERVKSKTTSALARRTSGAR